MDLTFDDDHVQVTIRWSRRLLLTDFVEKGTAGVDVGNEFLYLITAVCGRSERCVYVGQSFSSLVRRRLCAPDHRRKRKKWAAHDALAGREFQVRLGTPIVAGKGRGAITSNLVDDVEAILIYVFDDADVTQNERSRRRHRIRNLYEIRNEGLPKRFPTRVGYGFYAMV